MRVKIYPFILYFIQFGKRKNLKPAAVRKDRPVPVHKLVKSARLFYELIAGTKIQMISV